MKKITTLLAVAFAVTAFSAKAQCFVLREAAGSGMVKAIAEPSNMIGGWFGIGEIWPTNTRLFRWNSNQPVVGTIEFYGFGKDDPNTRANEGTIMLHYPSVPVAPSYYGTYSFRFSECDVQFLSDYDARTLREFVAQITFKNAVTGAYVDAAYFRWAR